MAYISVVIVIIKIGYLVALTPSIRGEYEHGKHVLFCNVSGFGTDTIYFFENEKSVAEISNNFNDCKTKLLKNAMECYCYADSLVACTIAMHTNPNYCYTWACTAIHDGVLQRSNSINVCTNDENNNSKKTTELDCLSVSTNVPMDPVRWVVDNTYNLDAGMLFPTEGFNKENISLLIESMQRDENGSIVVCQLDEERQLHWAINILYPPALCSAYESIHSIHPTCTLSNGNPIIQIVRRVNVAPKCRADSSTLYPDVLMLCDAVNRVNTGAESFVGNKTGHFKLEILYEASIKEFRVEGFNIKTNISSNDPRQVTFKCQGNGNPPPEMTLVHDAVEYGRGYSLLTHTMTLKGSDDCGNYTCIAANAFGVGSETIHISCHKETYFHQDLPQDATTIIQLNYIVLAAAGALVLIVIIVAVACVYRIYKRMKLTENVVLPMTDLLTTSATAAPIPVIDQSVIYHEIDPLMIESDRADLDVPEQDNTKD
ncbi:uncharacterized protein LOC127870493 isoform X2 [Dreissena polymorpha]|uniref:uncharacterized protein LOC127870493 isoform X2 n=1 Tax=Dreissena polymorpha TaxID=45954 RepID=UPI00226487BC|nr:uncharacterized protein LOC127870493 isoform X2 [Dreissena polymorpha]